MADEAPRLDPQALARLRRLGGDDLVARMIAIFFENAPERLQRARRAAEQEDATGVERATHSLKSMAANIGALRLYGLSESIEVDAAAGARDLSARVEQLSHELDAVLAALEELKEAT